MGFTVTIKKCEKEIFEFFLGKLQEIKIVKQEIFKRSNSLKILKESNQLQFREK